MERRTFFKWTSAAAGTMLLGSQRVRGLAEQASEGRLTDLLPQGAPGKFATTLLPGLGLSLSHSGLVNTEAVARLRLFREEDGQSDNGHKVRRLSLEDRDKGLRVTLDYTLFPEHHAIVYGAVLENVGLENIEDVTNLFSYDLVFKPLQAIGDPLVHTSKGGAAFNFYPPAAWTP